MSATKLDRTSARSLLRALMEEYRDAVRDLEGDEAAEALDLSPFEEAVEALSPSGGIYARLAAALEEAEAERASYASIGRSGHGAALGTRSQDLILLEAARLVSRDPNGCRLRFASLLAAHQDEFGPRGWGRQVLCSVDREGELRPVREAPHFRERARRRAEDLVLGRAPLP